MIGVKHTPGPLTVRVSECWPYDIETVNADGHVVFSDRMTAHSTAMRSQGDLWKGVGFPVREREEIVEVNRRAVADATIRAAAPDLLEAGAELQAARKAHKLAPSAENLSRVRIASDAFDAALARARGEA